MSMADKARQLNELRREIPVSLLNDVEIVMKGILNDIAYLIGDGDNFQELAILFNEAHVKTQELNIFFIHTAQRMGDVASRYLGS